MREQSKGRIMKSRQKFSHERDNNMQIIIPFGRTLITSTKNNWNPVYVRPVRIQTVEDFLKLLHVTGNETKAMFLQIFLTAFRVFIN